MGVILNDLTDIQYDALKELTHIGAATAVTALSQFINKTVKILPPTTARFNSKEVPQLTSKEIPANTIVFLEILGNISGKITIVFDGKSSLFLTGLLMGKELSPDAALSEMDISAIKEVATVMSGSYLKSLGEMVNSTFQMSPPSFEYSNSENILRLINSYSSDEDVAPTCFRSDFMIDDCKVKLYGLIIFLPSAASLQNLAQAIMPEGN